MSNTKSRKQPGNKAETRTQAHIDHLNALAWEWLESKEWYAERDVIFNHSSDEMSEVCLMLYNQASSLAYRMKKAGLSVPPFMSAWLEQWAD
jgi:hypothetical protein